MTFAIWLLSTNELTPPQQEVQSGEPPPVPCWRADPRLERPEQDQCQRMLTTDLYHANNISLIQLFPQGELFMACSLRHFVFPLPEFSKAAEDTKIVRGIIGLNGSEASQFHN